MFQAIGKLGDEVPGRAAVGSPEAERGARL